jgi:predicted ArsR family transcriptional regulator
MKTSRQKLLDYVRDHRAVTAGEVSQALKMTEANARHHLEILREQGVVQVTGRRPSTGKGRPARIFTQSEQSLGHNLERLASALLEEIASQMPLAVTEGEGTLSLAMTDKLVDNLPQAPSLREVVTAQDGFQLEKEVWRRIARRLAQAPIQPALPREDTKRQGTRLTQALYQSVQQLNEMHYQARWEARADAPRVIFGHCPYAAVLAEHPEICQLDVSLLEEMLGQPVEQTARLAKDGRGMTYCAFRIVR